MSVEDGIAALAARGFWFQVVRDDDGEVSVIVGSYGWPECYDRLHIWGEDEAIAARLVPSGRPGADDVLWTYQADAEATITALLDLPAPGGQNAPRLAKRAPSGLWLPPSGARV